MFKNMTNYFLLLLCIMVSGCLADKPNPLKDPKICGRPQCDMDNQKFVYKRLVRYQYNYESHVRTEFNGPGQNTSDLFATATVILTFPKNCEGAMQINDVKLFNKMSSDSEPNKYSDNFAYEVQKYELRFAFHDGLIGEVCPSGGESVWSLNFKRGILSSLQNTMSRFDIDFVSRETDVSGSCDTKYVIRGSEKTSLHIQKTKDISTCSNRYKMDSFLQTTSYDFRQHYTAWPIVQSQSYCNITIDHYIYQGVTCYERHQLVPFSNNDTGATTTTSVKLTLIDEVPYEIVQTYDEEPSIERRESLTYNHTPTPKPTSGEIKASRDLLQKMCKQGFPDIKRQFIDTFTKFLQTAKHLSSGALHQLLARSSNICIGNQNGRKHILESLPYIGSAASIKMMVNEIISKSVPADTVQKWLTSISFTSRPDVEMLESMYRLLEFAVLIDDASLVLTPSTVAHTFCRHHGECGETEQIRRIVDFLEREIIKLVASDLTNRHNRDKIVFYLKALGNVGFLSDNFHNQMTRIIIDDEVPPLVRVLTVNAHRRDNCLKNHDYFLNVFRILDLNSEVRIAAYLQVMRCPDYVSMRHIKAMLQSEEVNQVGSFVWSHLKNTAKSASPVHVELQGLVADDDLSNKFNLDMRKFSRNYEHSIFFDQYNMGASGDANIIFATDSYLPRTASFNFTVDLFGESINIFEIDAHAQGFEHLFEGMFGPKGPLSRQGFSKKVDAMTKFVKDKIQPYKTEYLDHLNLRLRRDAEEQESRDIEDDVNELDYKLKYDMNNPHLGLGLRVFGNDIKYKSMDGLGEISDLLLELNPVNQVKSLLSGHEITYTKSGVFLDASYIVPMCSGFPLAIEAYGASSIDLRASGSLKGDNFWSNPNFHIKGMIKPSISLDVIVSMKSDFFFGTTGVRVKSNLYSSSSIEADFKVNGKNYVSLQFGLPQDRNEIISVKSDIFVIEKDVEVRQRGIPKRYVNSTCTWPAIERAVGLKVCSDYSLPDLSRSTRELPSVLLCGPISINMHIDKADLSAKSFLFEYKWNDYVNRSVGSLIFETPNTDVPRIFMANITKEPEIYNLSMSFVNGRTLHAASAVYKNSPEEKLIEAHLNIDGAKRFAFAMGLNQTEIRHGWMYYPRLLLTVNNDEIASLSGDVKMIDKRNIIQYDPNLRFHTKRFETEVKGFVVKTDLKCTIRLLLNYKFQDSKVEYIELNSELARKVDKISGSSFTGMLKWNTTAYKKFNFAADFNYTQLLGHIDLSLNVNNAIDFVDPRFTTGIRVILVLSSEDKDFIARSKLSLELVRPIANVNYKFMIKHESKYKGGLVHNFLFLLGYAKDKEATAVVSAMLPSPYSRNTDVYVNVTVPSFGSSSIHVKANEYQPNQYLVRVYGTWFTGQSIKVDGIYEDKSSLSESRHHLKLSIKSPSFNETNLVALYINNDTDLIFDTKANYDDQAYGVVLKHMHANVNEHNVYSELKIRGKIYSLNANINNQQSKLISIDLHIEGVRDIEIVLRGHSTSIRKETGIEIKWDANRDDTQKLVLTAEFNTPRYKVFDGGFTFSYPERTFSGSFDLSIPGPKYHGNLSIGWSANDAIDFSFDAGTAVAHMKNSWLRSQLLTPFDGWRRNSLDFNSLHGRNYVSTNATALWAENQRLGFGILTDFDLGDPKIRCEAKLLINSTVKDIPTIDLNLRHSYDGAIYDTSVALHKVPQPNGTHVEKPQLYSFKSKWKLEMTNTHKNISGSLAMKSPLKGYTNGALATKFSLSAKNMLQGAADLEMSGKRFTLAVKGVVKKIMDCMLEVNITTPIEKYRNIRGRFGLIDYKRHIVAEMRAPQGALGIEVKLFVANISNFDIIFNAETPIASFEKAMLIAKLNSEVIDFRGGLNKTMLGYVAVSRKLSYKDFEYSWKVYTPLPKFEESSLVIKNVHRKLLEFEAMLIFAQKKIGVVIDSAPKQHIIVLPSVSTFQFESSLSEVFDRFKRHYEAEIAKAKAANDAYAEEENGYGEDDEGEEVEEIDESAYANQEEATIDWNFIGHMELETIVWPTISGNIDAEDNAGENYIVTGNINLPFGSIEFRDHLYYPDYLNIQNALRIETPNEAFKEIEFLYSHSVIIQNYYISALQLFYKNQTQWIELGYNSNYTSTVDENDAKAYGFEVNLLLPFEKLPRVSFVSGIETEENILRAKIAAATHETSIAVGGSLEKDINFVDVSVALNIDAPIVPNYSFKVFFKKDLSDVENTIEVGFEEQNINGTSNLRLESVWHTEASNYVRMTNKLTTNIFPIVDVDASFFFNRSVNFNSALDLTFVTMSQQTSKFYLSAVKRKEQININLKTPLPEFANISMIGSFSPLSQSGNYLLQGKLYRNFEIYNFDGTVQLDAQFPVAAELQLKPVSRTGVGSLTYSLRNHKTGYGKTLQLRIAEEEKFFQVNGSLNIFSKINWSLDSMITASPGFLSNQANANKCEFSASLKAENSGRLVGNVRMNSPWKHLGLDAIEASGSLLVADHSGDAQVEYTTSLANGRTKCAWNYLLFENMYALIDTTTNREKIDPRALRVAVRYMNPGLNLSRLNFGGSFAVDSIWLFESNGTLNRNKKDMTASLAIRMPKPTEGLHRFTGRFDGDVMNEPWKGLQYEAKYDSELDHKRFSSRGFYRNVTDLQAMLQAQWGIGRKLATFETNFNLLRKGEKRDFSAKLTTPKFSEDTLTTTGSYDWHDSSHFFNGVVNYPASHRIITTDIAFASVSHVSGFINSTTPFPQLTWLRGDMNFSSSTTHLRRYIKATWPQDFTFFDLENAITARDSDRDHQGTVVIEAPLATRHFVDIQYDLKERQRNTLGHCTINYDRSNLVKGEYLCKSEITDGRSKDVYSISLENKLQPIGIQYVHQTEAPRGDILGVDMKHLEVYELTRSDLYNVTGEFFVRTTKTGYAYTVRAIHPNRTVVFTSDYDFRDATSHRHSKLELAPDVWIAYDLKLQNLTTPEKESQNFDVALSYPRRNLSTSGWYSITGDVFDSDLAFKWTREKTKVEVNYDYDYGDEEKTTSDTQHEERTVNAALTWRNEPLNENDRSNQTVLITLYHPAFTKNVTFNANYYRSNIDLVHGKLVIDYHEYPEHLLTVEGGIFNYTSLLNYRNYSVSAFGSHAASEFNLQALASIAARPGIYETKNFGIYKRSYLPLQEGLFNAGVDLYNNDIHYRKVSPQKTFAIWTRVDGEFPIYTMNATYEDSPDINTTAEFYANIDNRLIRLNANFTPDATQNMQMLGIIPDARSAKFHLLRDYEDIRIVDIAYYLRMNHSRLITSQLIWRPKLKTEVKEKLRQSASQFYDTFSENIDFWLKTLRTETMETVNDVWTNAKPHAQEFIDDISGLSVLESDFDEFRRFLNQSYEANDFYAKTVVNFTLTILDELAIRNHIGSVPKILNEIWQILGESRTAISKSILKLIESIKNYYRNAIDFISRIFHGEATTYISSLVEKAVYSYDKIIKDLHLSFIKYVQKMWNRISDTITEYWRRLLHGIQPSVMKIFHYAESVLWNISSEILDFLNKRTNELIESPYYDTISKLTQELDRIYHDIRNNDAFTNIRKYTALAWAFAKEKYFKVVPFSRELQNITNEIAGEFVQLQKLELVQFMLGRVSEWEEKFAWFVEEFQLDRRAQLLWQIIIEKLTSYEQSALQNDDKYREPKTYFVFDPDAGLIQLEQKLPMSWHAFNETPLFEEISEIKFAGKVFRLFNGVNISVVNPLEQFQYYMNPHTWLPPFKARSLLVGSRHYVTFDGRVVSIDHHRYELLSANQTHDKCSYLLAHDFDDSNFTLVQRPAMNAFNNYQLTSRKLVLAVEGNQFDIDMVAETIQINRALTTTLPVKIGETVVYRENDILILQSTNGFQLNCNLQFDLCWFQLSGWYYGKTAGLLGTMNNEMFDDFLTSKHQIAADVDIFRHSWSFDRCTHEDRRSTKDHRDEWPLSNELLNICDTFFRSKVSQMGSCFGTVDPMPFYEMCLDMGSNSISNFTQVNHPAHKGVCAVALAYIEICIDQNIPLRVPDTCVHCNLNNGSFVPEGQFFELRGSDIPRTADFVFIVEAKECNRDAIRNKNLMSVLHAFNKQLNESNFNDNRFAVVAFGGDAPFDHPNSIVYDNQIFSNGSNLRSFFEHIHVSNGTSVDVSQAIKVASDLVFRPGASKVFILIPCSNCNASHMRFDYSSIHQTLVESNIKLHILMEGDIETKRARNEQRLFGFDKDFAFTNKYVKDPHGEKELRNEITLPKQKLGTCLALAMISDGSVFTANKLRPSARAQAKKFAAAFAKRVVKSAEPSECQSCECTGHNTGISYITCTKCDYPIDPKDYADEDFAMKNDEIDFSWSEETMPAETDD